MMAARRVADRADAQFKLMTRLIRQMMNRNEKKAQAQAKKAAKRA